MEKITIICSQNAMGVKEAEDICDDTALEWVLGCS